MKLHNFSVFSVLLLASCASLDSITNPTESVFLLTGSYATTVTALDIIHYESFDDLTITQGEWVWLFTESGNYTLNLNGLETARGTVTPEGDQMKVHISSVSGIIRDGPCFDQVGQYVWALEDDELSFARVAGMCDVIDLVLTSRPLQRQP